MEEQVKSETGHDLKPKIWSSFNDSSFVWTCEVNLSNSQTETVEGHLDFAWEPDARPSGFHRNTYNGSMHR